jgi:hypothetical protein
MINNRRLHIALLVSAMLAQASMSRAQGDPAAVLHAPGFQQNRDYFSALPFENIDTATGGLVLTFTDLVLPGNAGRDLRFQRTYNNKVGYWTFGIAGVPLQVGDSWWGNPGGDDLAVSFHTVDGGIQRAAMQLTSVPGNGLGRVIEEKNPGGTIRTRSYAGNTVTTTDENGRATELTHHAFGDPDEDEARQTRRRQESGVELCLRHAR